MHMRRLFVTALVVAVASAAVPVRADDKPDPTGTWKWMTGREGRQREVAIKLKLEGDKLTGTIGGANGKDQAIEDATWKDGEISFSVTRERNGTKNTAKYTGKVSGDSIKGKIETERNGKPRSQTWEAKRSKD
jgi:hypothetical protein